MVEKQTDKKRFNSSLASAMFGFIGLFPAAIIFGHLALSKINRNEQNYSSADRRMAYGGLILGYLWLLPWLYFALLFFAKIFEWDISFLFPFGIQI